MVLIFIHYKTHIGLSYSSTVCTLHDGNKQGIDQQKVHCFLLIDSLLTPIVESTYLNTDMCKFESSQNDESRAQLAYFSKVYRKHNAFNWIKLCLTLTIAKHRTCIVHACSIFGGILFRSVVLFVCKNFEQELMIPISKLGEICTLVRS